jgi:hypothetical protein
LAFVSLQNYKDTGYLSQDFGEGRHSLDKIPQHATWNDEDIVQVIWL